MKIETIARIFFRPVSFARLKIVLFPALVAGVSLDWVVIFNPETKNLQASSGSDGLIVPILLIIVFILLILLDYFNYVRIQKFKEKILKIQSNPMIPDHIRKEIGNLL